MDNFQTAVVTCTTIGELYGDTSEHDDNGVLERLKQLVKNNFPEGWREWKVARLSKEDTVGANPDPQLLNKLRYALPTIGIATAFKPEATFLSERPYRDYKAKMLDWAFCRALIMSPSALANLIRGSATQTMILLQKYRIVYILCWYRDKKARIN
ncbi:unnamed protein product [Parnassius apollo]|uniref:(apollo) hypothetical protein n=1 Tax=Parnassius apollo TaxID=110799 RepID=A0A8S3WDC0_PARAO|nr:unnamed protein product [Parnassius apollo]